MGMFGCFWCSLQIFIVMRRNLDVQDDDDESYPVNQLYNLVVSCSFNSRLCSHMFIFLRSILSPGKFYRPQPSSSQMDVFFSVYSPKTPEKKSGLGITHWKFNIAPENIPSQKESSLPTIIFQGLC